MIELKCKVNVRIRKPKGESKPKDAPLEPEPTPKRRGKIPRISRLTALGIRMDEMLKRGEAEDTLHLAEMCKVSQPRVTQILSLSLLAPDIQEALLFLPRETVGKTKIHETKLRPIAKEVTWERQRELWRQLLAETKQPLSPSPED